MDILGLIALAKSQNGGSANRVFHFKGVKSAANLLPIQGEEGDVYKVEEDSYYAWDGTNWVDIGEVLSVDEAEELINELTSDVDNLRSQLTDYITKDSIGNAGISARSYTTIMEETVTTASDETHLSPYNEATATYNFDKRYLYRVTFDGMEYVLPCQLHWRDESTSTVIAYKVYEYIGNLSLYTSVTGVTNDILNVPFVFVNDVVSSNAIEVLTQTAGEHSVKIEKIINTQTKLPESLIYGENYHLVNELDNGTSTYDSISIGVNTLTNKRGTIAIGFANTCEHASAIAIGGLNISSGNISYAEGFGTTSSAGQSHTEGFVTTASGDQSHAEGQGTTASGDQSHAEGYRTTASGFDAHAEGQQSVASGFFSHAEGLRAEASGFCSHAHGKRVKANSSCQTVFGVCNVIDTPDSDGNGTYVEIVGNGTTDNDRSNARTLDWSGNESLAGGITLGMGTADEVTLGAAQLKQLLTLLNNPVAVTGTDPVITALPGVSYKCGEVATLTVTLPASGDVEIIFDSGSTATVLTVTPPTGVTAVKWVNGFDSTTLDANTRYDLIITDGEWGLAASWA